MKKPKLGPESEHNSEPFDFFEFNGIPRPGDLSDLKDTNFQNLPPKRDPQLRKFLARLFVILVVFGVALGGVVSFGIAKLMDKAGLLDVPEKQEVEKAE